MPDHYRWAGGREALLRLGPRADPPVLFAPALFEEANRTRALTLAVMRGLAARGVASVLPDLPGQGESLLPTAEARLADWQAAFAAAAHETGARHAVAIRGGALVDAQADVRRYHLSPTDGAAIVRDLVRIRLAGMREGGDRFDPADMLAPGPPIELGGNRIGRAMLRDLGDAMPSRAERTVRLEGDPRTADRRLPGRTLWRAAEPDGDAALADALAADVATWVAPCAG